MPIRDKFLSKLRECLNIYIYTYIYIYIYLYIHFSKWKQSTKLGPSHLPPSASLSSQGMASSARRSKRKAQLPASRKPPRKQKVTMLGGYPVHLERRKRTRPGKKKKDLGFF